MDHIPYLLRVARRDPGDVLNNHMHEQNLYYDSSVEYPKHPTAGDMVRVLKEHLKLLK